MVHYLDSRCSDTVELPSAPLPGATDVGITLPTEFPFRRAGRSTGDEDDSDYEFRVAFQSIGTTGAAKVDEHIAGFA